MSDTTLEHVVAGVLETITDECVNRYDEQAAMILNAVREANTVTAEAELEVLPTDSTILIQPRHILQRGADGAWFEPGGYDGYLSSELRLPAVVLFRPGTGGEA